MARAVFRRSLVGYCLTFCTVRDSRRYGGCASARVGCIGCIAYGYTFSHVGHVLAFIRLTDSLLCSDFLVCLFWRSPEWSSYSMIQMQAQLGGAIRPGVSPPSAALLRRTGGGGRQAR